MEAGLSRLAVRVWWEVLGCGPPWVDAFSPSWECSELIHRPQVLKIVHICFNRVPGAHV